MTSNDQNEAPDIETLTAHYQELNKRKIESERDLVNAEKNLDELKQQALSDYGTDNLDELKEKLEQIKTENERKRAEYHQTLGKIETELANIETEHQATDTP
ncbi:hypothetical protein [uncultured Gimesia sp.]|uniref:hypothetical protein n=1 Tax=uncultured Gimesia sp. TaxID=1678688 RepID=UPI00262FBAB6|nr:hypothetical protein [uncultured Gimesia sp.]